MSKTAEGGRLAYADLLRTAAMLAVIALHVAGGRLASLPVSSAGWDSLNLWDGALRWCVPVFVMTSGMFLLDPKKDVSLPRLFFRYLLRLGTALLFWGTAYFLLHDALNGIFGWESLPRALKEVVWGQRVEEHLWYLYMMAGLYLITPILRAFVRGARRSDFHWFFLVTAVFAFALPILLKLRPSLTLSLYYEKLQLHLVLGYVGYYVAGYYLKTFTLNRAAEGLVYLLGVAGGIATVWGTRVLSLGAMGLDEVLYSYFSPTVAAMAVAVFVLFRYVLGVSEERSRRQRVGRAARLSFGVYLCHVVFLLLLRHFGLDSPPIPAGLAVPLLTLAVFLPSLALSWLLSKIPVAGRYLV